MNAFDAYEMLGIILQYAIITSDKKMFVQPWPSFENDVNINFHNDLTH